jgi:NOL1/NOP2/sun family putative RNA methylase
MRNKLEPQQKLSPRAKAKVRKIAKGKPKHPSTKGVVRRVKNKVTGEFEMPRRPWTVTPPRRGKSVRNKPVAEERKFFTKKEVFLSRMASILQVPPKMARSFFSQRVVSALRLNPLAANPEQIKQKLIDQDIELTAVPWSPYTFIVTNADKSALARMEEYKKGLFYLQSLSSMLPVIVLDPKPGEKILDLAAAPGSKTSQIASLTNNKAEIFANDNSHIRARKLNEILRLFYVKGVKVTVGEGEKMGDVYPNEFDKVLLDAPCSGEGQIYLQGDKPLRFWHAKKVERMAVIQKNLIISAYKSLKPGGILVYSTCTLEPEENEEVVTHLLDTFKGAELVNISIDSTPDFADYKQYVSRGIRKWSSKEYNQFSGRALRVKPGSVMTGFYVAKIRKNQ